MQVEWSTKERILPTFKKTLLTKNNKNIEILWASTREFYNYIHKQLNCNIITMPPKMINQEKFRKKFRGNDIRHCKRFQRIVKNQNSNFKLIF